MSVISRRNLLKTSAASGLIAALPGRAWTAGPKRGGHLVMASAGGSTADSLDPRAFNSPYSAAMSGIIYNTLVEVSGIDLMLRPGLAKSWEASNGSRTWTFDLREDVTFHNGKPFSSEDALFSLKRHGEEASQSSVRGFIAELSDIRTDGPNRIVIDLSAPNYLFPAVLSHYALGIIPANTMTFDGVGTGPYKLTKFSPGDTLEGVRNEQYFKRNAAYVDSVECLSINDPSALASALQAGQVNLTTELDPRTALLMGQMPNLKIFDTPGRGYVCFNMRVDMPPFDNPDMRMALKLAINRPDMLRRVYSGSGQIGHDTPIAPIDPAYDARLPQNQYDPERAKALFDKVGHKGSIVLHTSDAISSYSVDMAVVFQEHAARAGIPFEVRREPADGYWQTIPGQVPFCVSASPGWPTADMAFSNSVLSTASPNQTKWVNKDFDAAVIAARAEVDIAKQNAFYATAQKICNKDGSIIIPFFPNGLEGATSDLEGFVPAAMNLAAYRAVEEVWFL